MRTGVFLIALFCAGRAAADPIKIQPISVTASNYWDGNLPQYAVDGNPSTLWNSGGTAPQWILLDLGHTVAVEKIRLLVAQSPSGWTNHTIAVGQDKDHLTDLWQFIRPTSDGQWLDTGLFNNRAAGNVRYVRITTTQSPSWVAWKEIEIYQGVEYIGYFNDAGTDNYMTGTVGNGANLVWVGGTNADVASKIQQAQSLGARAMVCANLSLFAQNPDGSQFLLSDWQTRWQSLRDVVRAAPAGAVVALFLSDEPVLHNVSVSTLTTVVNQIKADFPSLPIVGILQTDDIKTPSRGQPYAPIFDWIGFDCYDGTWDTCAGVGMDSMIGTLRTWLHAGQRMIAIPWAKRWSDSDLSLRGQNENVSMIGAWQKELLADPTYVAIMPYLWQTVGNEVGTRDLPWIREKMFQVKLSMFPTGDPRVFALNYTASSTQPNSNYLPFSAFDRDSSTMWNAGNYPTQYIEASFGGSTRVANLQLIPAQSQAGTTTHVAYGLNTSGSYVWLDTLQSWTSDNTAISWTLPVPADVTAIRVTTIQSPSWVAWREIQFFPQ